MATRKIFRPENCGKAFVMVLIFSLSFLFPSMIWSQQPTAFLFLGDSDKPPVSFQENGVPKGVFIEITEALGKAVDIPIQISVMNWTEAQQKVRSGEADAIFGLVLTEQRRAEFDLSDSVGQNEYCFFMLKETVGIETLDDLPGRRIAVSSAGYVRKILEPMKNVRVRIVSSFEEGFRLVRGKEVDAFATDRWIGGAYIREHHFTDLAVSNNPFAIFSSGFGVKKGNRALLQKINEGIQVLKARGEIQRIQAKWGPHSMVFLKSEELWNWAFWGSVVVGIVLIVLLTVWVMLLSSVLRRKGEAERKLLKWAHIFENAKMGIVIVNPPDQIIEMMNPAYAEMHGFPMEDLIGKSIYDLFPEELRSLAAEKVQTAVSSGRCIFESVHLRKGGHRFPVAVDVTAVRDQTNQVVYFVGHVQDISEKEKTELLVRNAQKLESLGVLAGGIAHDFNNLLAGIFSNVELAQINLERGFVEKTAPLLAKTTTVLDRARQLTQQLLTFSKGGLPVKKNRNLAEVIDKSVEFALSGSNVTTNYSLAKDVLCEIDEFQIAQLIDNIVLNARQAMPEGGLLTVSLKRVARTSETERLRKGEYALVTFEDTGPGIDAAILPRIFDPFFTTKEHGSGLGLATSYSIARKHGGILTAESATAGGARFCLFLPIAGELPIDVKKVSEKYRFSERKRVLILDDDVVLLEAFEKMLDELGLDSALAKGSNEARVLIQEQSADSPFSVAILDLTIPGEEGGKELAANLQVLYPNLILVASSGYSNDPVMANPKEFGFQRSLKKPYTLQELSDLLQDLLEKKNS